MNNSEASFDSLVENAYFEEDVTDLNSKKKALKHKRNVKQKLDSLREKRRLAQVTNTLYDMFYQDNLIKE